MATIGLRPLLLGSGFFCDPRLPSLNITKADFSALLQLETWDQNLFDLKK